MKRRKRASGFLTGVLLLVLLLGVGVQLYRLQDKLRTAREEEAALAAQIAQVQEKNDELLEDLENADDPELIQDIARQELGMVMQNEKVFYVQGG